MPVPQLPLEVVALVLNHLFGDLRDQQDQSPTRREAMEMLRDFQQWRRQSNLVLRVCKGWTTVARAAIWYEVVLVFSLHETQALAEHILLHFDEIAPHVRSVCTGGGSHPRHPTTALALHTLLTRTPGLNSVYFDHTSASARVDDSAQPLTRILGASPVRHTLTSLMLTATCTVADAFNLINALPNMTGLVTLALRLMFPADGRGEVVSSTSAHGQKLSKVNCLALDFPDDAPTALYTALSDAVAPTFSIVQLAADVPASFWEYCLSSPNLNDAEFVTDSFIETVLPRLHLLPPSLELLTIPYPHSMFDLFSPPPPPLTHATLLSAIPTHLRFSLDLGDEAYCLDDPPIAPSGLFITSLSMPVAEDGTPEAQCVTACVNQICGGTKVQVYWREFRDGKAIGEWYIEPDWDSDEDETDEDEDESENDSGRL
ncbi:hypothetical protein JCM8097_000292 [Rhodosporidiobolus ruineniae]